MRQWYVCPSLAAPLTPGGAPRVAGGIVGPPDLVVSRPDLSLVAPLCSKPPADTPPPTHRGHAICPLVLETSPGQHHLCLLADKECGFFPAAPTTPVAAGTPVVIVLL